MSPKNSYPYDFNELFKKKKPKKSRVKLWLLTIAVVFLIFYFYKMIEITINLIKACNPWPVLLSKIILINQVWSFEMELKYIPMIVNDQKDETVL